MKKIVFPAILMASLFANAQESKFGAKLGMNISTIKGDVSDAQSLFGGYGGFFAEVPVSDNFAVQPEVYFSMQGVRSESTSTSFGNTTETENKYKIDYLNVPVLGKFIVSKDFSILAGPQFGFVLSAKSEYDSTTRNGSGAVVLTDAKSEDIEKYINNVDIGLAFGAAFNLSENVFVEGRYNLGLMNIDKEDSYKFGNVTATSEAIDTKNSVFQVGLGFIF